MLNCTKKIKHPQEARIDFIKKNLGIDQKNNVIVLTTQNHDTLKVNDTYHKLFKVSGEKII